MTYILHRKINQPKTGRRLLQNRRIEDSIVDNERRASLQRRLIADRRKSKH